jgi:hypothetical protein
MKKLALLLLALPLAACAATSPKLLVPTKNVQGGTIDTPFFVPASPDAPLPGQKQASELRQKQFAEAQNSCEAQGVGPSIGSAGSVFWHCVNAYLWPRYKWHAALNPDGSLHVIGPFHPLGYQPGYFF